MSLTKLIEKDKELRDKIRSAFSRPKRENKPLLAEPLTKNYGLVGTAFDYIFRFFLEKINNPSNPSQAWIAERGIERGISLFGGEVGEVFEIGSEIIKNVKELKEEFIQTGNLSEELIRQTLRMSYIDIFYRAPIGMKDIGKDADKADIEDIKNQFSLIDEKLFRSEEICLLNPEFGEATRLVHGADADFLIDKKLIDIKTTKNLQLKLEDFCQMIGYLMLHRISGIDERKDIEMDQLGIYYSRYGYLFLFDIKDLIDDYSLQKFTEWFERRIRR